MPVHALNSLVYAPTENLFAAGNAGREKGPFGPLLIGLAVCPTPAKSRWSWVLPRRAAELHSAVRIDLRGRPRDAPHERAARRSHPVLRPAGGSGPDPGDPLRRATR